MTTAANETAPVTELEKPQAPKAPAKQKPQEAKRPEVVVDDSGAFAAYANFARVSGTPEEMIIDFGLNPQPLNTEKQEVKVAQRLIVNYFTAKRLLAALGMAVQRHEGAFGSLELDVRRRVSMPAAKAAG